MGRENQALREFLALIGDEEVIARTFCRVVESRGVLSRARCCYLKPRNTAQFNFDVHLSLLKHWKVARGKLQI